MNYDYYDMTVNSLGHPFFSHALGHVDTELAQLALFGLALVMCTSMEASCVQKSSF